MFQEGVKPSLLKKKEKKIIRREIYQKKREKKREKKKERVREPWLHTLKQQHTHTQIRRLLLFLSKPLLLHSDRSGFQEALFPFMRQEYHMPSLQQF